MLNKLYICRVCGYDNKDYVWGEDGKTPSFNICPCCGAEFGYHDGLEEAILSHRKKWLVSGALWNCPEMKPMQWDLEEQLKRVL